MIGKDFTDHSQAIRGKFKSSSEILLRKYGDPDNPLGFGRTNLEQLNEYISFDPIIYESLVGFTEYYQSFADRIAIATAEISAAVPYINENNSYLSSISASHVDSYNKTVLWESVNEYTAAISAALVNLGPVLASFSAIGSYPVESLNSMFSIITANSASWNEITTTYSTITSNSANWTNTYTTVNANSGAW